MHRLVKRSIFAIAVATVPLQFAIREVASEPYPGLFLPSFGGTPQSGRTAVTGEPRITATFPGGRERVLQLDDVLPPPGVIPSAILWSAFFEDSVRAQDPRTLRMVARRVHASTGHQPLLVRIEWLQVRYDLMNGERVSSEVLESVTLDLAGRA